MQIFGLKMRAKQKISNTTCYKQTFSINLGTRQGKGIALISEVNVLLAFSYSNWAYEQRNDHIIIQHNTRQGYYPRFRSQHPFSNSAYNYE